MYDAEQVISTALSAVLLPSLSLFGKTHLRVVLMRMLRRIRQQGGFIAA